MANTRIDLDEKMLIEINKYYTAKLEDNHLHKECFSHPDLNSHFCCIKSPMHGGRVCDYCGHQPGRICKITCNIHEWCLATYAVRLGMGNGKNLYAKIKDLIKNVKYEDLLNRVREAEKNRTTTETEEVTHEVTTPVYEVRELEKIVGDLPTEVLEEENLFNKEETEMNEENTNLPNDLVSIKEAAEAWPCTLPNLYAKIKTGVLEAYDVDGHKRVSMAAVEALKAKKRGGGRKKKTA